MIAYQLTHDLNISAPTGYEISLNSSSGFGSSLSLSQNAGEVDTTSIYVRLNSSSSNGISGNLVFTSNGAFTVNIPTGDGIVGMDSLYVSSSGSNSNYGTSISTPYANLTYAVSKVRCPSTIISVAAGTYSDDLLDISDVSNLSIEGNGMGSTIFDQSGSGDHFLEIKDNSNNISISGMTIKDYDENNNGGALDITATGSVILEDIHFDNNRTTSYSDDGGAVYISSNSTVTFDRCKFTNNSSYNVSTSNGSCIYSEGNLNLYNTLFYDNTCNYGNSTTYSGHVYLRTESSGSQTSIINCTFTENNNGNPVLYYDGASGKHFQQNNLFFNNSSTYDVVERYANSDYPIMNNCFYESRTGDFNVGSESGNLISGSVEFFNPSSDDFTFYLILYALIVVMLAVFWQKISMVIVELLVFSWYWGLWISRF